MMSYLSEVLCRIGTRSKTVHDMFYLHSATRSHIIALGIRKKPRLYRGSKAGRSTVDHIHTIITNHEKTKSNFNLKQNVVLSNLLSIQPSKERHNHLCLAHVNAWSIRNKISPFQHSLLDEKIDMYVLQRPGSNLMMLFIQKKLSHQDMISYPNQEVMEDWEEGLPLLISHPLRLTTSHIPTNQPDWSI